MDWWPSKKYKNAKLTVNVNHSSIWASCGRIPSETLCGCFYCFSNWMLFIAQLAKNLLDWSRLEKLHCKIHYLRIKWKFFIRYLIAFPRFKLYLFKTLSSLSITVFSTISNTCKERRKKKTGLSNKISHCSQVYYFLDKEQF